MDFTPRGGRPVPQDQPAQTHQSVPVATQRSAKTSSTEGGLHKLASFFMLVAVAVLSLAVIGLMVFGSPKPDNAAKQAEGIKTDKYQAVFLNGGQVYFGKIVRFNEDFIALQDIYYLRVNQQVQPGQETASNDISLAKLGSELHGPEDVMYINADEVQFWENLKDDGQVVKAIKAYQANPEAATQQQNQQQNNNNANGTSPAGSGNNNSDTDN